MHNELYVSIPIIWVREIFLRIPEWKFFAVYDEDDINYKMKIRKLDVKSTLYLLNDKKASFSTRYEEKLELNLLNFNLHRYFFNQSTNLPFV